MRQDSHVKVFFMSFVYSSDHGNIREGHKSNENNTKLQQHTKECRFMIIKNFLNAFKL